MLLGASLTTFHGEVKGRRFRVKVIKLNQEIILIKLDQIIELVRLNQIIELIKSNQII